MQTSDIFDLTNILLLLVLLLVGYRVYKVYWAFQLQKSQSDPKLPGPIPYTGTKATGSVGGANSFVFISYARLDASLAKRLADTLTANGFSVWWDVNLVGSDQFRDEIQRNLRAAQAVIVIWSENSINSRFVRQEADEALHFGKLISTRVRGLTVLEIRLGFREQHTDYVDETAKVFAAVSKLMRM